MFHVLFVNLLFAACLPDLVNYTPTPMIQWNAVTGSDVQGYRIYDDFGGVLILLADLPREPCIDEDVGFCGWTYPGVDRPYPLQRATSVELDTIRLCIKAYTLPTVESVTCSTALDICMPDIWGGPPEPYN